LVARLNLHATTTLQRQMTTAAASSFVLVVQMPQPAITILVPYKTTAVALIPRMMDSVIVKETNLTPWVCVEVPVQRMLTRMGFVMTLTIAWANMTSVVFAKDQGRFTLVDAQMLPRGSAIAMATCWMSVVFVEVLEFLKETATATEMSLTSVECAEALEFWKENATAMATSWMSAVNVEVMEFLKEIAIATGVSSMNAVCAEEITPHAQVAPMSLLAIMTRLRSSLMSVCVNLERVEDALNSRRATSTQRSSRTTVLVSGAPVQALMSRQEGLLLEMVEERVTVAIGWSWKQSPVTRVASSTA